MLQLLQCRRSGNGHDRNQRYKTLKLGHVVQHYNGTLACDGRLLVGVRRCLTELSQQLSVSFARASVRVGTPQLLCGFSERNCLDDFHKHAISFSIMFK